MTYDDIIAEYGSDYSEYEYEGGYMIDYRESDNKMMIGFSI